MKIEQNFGNIYLIELASKQFERNKGAVPW
jgi:hypothetical protein